MASSGFVYEEVLNVFLFLVAWLLVILYAWKSQCHSYAFPFLGGLCLSFLSINVTFSISRGHKLFNFTFSHVLPFGLC